MIENKRKVGSNYEKAAGYYLEQIGYEILEYNYRCKLGEIDLIARDGEYLVFCEVKYRKSKRKDSPLQAVNRKKQKIIAQCAKWYLMERRLYNIPCRFDVVGIAGKNICVLKNAFMQ